VRPKGHLLPNFNRLRIGSISPQAQAVISAQFGRGDIGEQNSLHALFIREDEQIYDE
jgi:hypothetical protein